MYNQFSFFKPDMRPKITEYVVGLDYEIDRIEDMIREIGDFREKERLDIKMQILLQVKSDLQGMLDERT